MSEISLIVSTAALVVFLLYLSWTLADRSKSEFILPGFVLMFVLVAAALHCYAVERGHADSTLFTGLLLAGATLFGIVFNAAALRRTKARQRYEKRLDLRRDIRAEIADFVNELEVTASKRARSRVDAAFASERAFVPFVVSTRRDRVYSTVLTQLEVLDDSQVETVVRLNAVHGKLCDLENRMRNFDYALLSEDRRKAILVSANTIQDLLVDYGNAALRALGGNIPNAAVNNTGPVRSGREEAE